MHVNDFCDLDVRIEFGFGVEDLGFLAWGRGLNPKTPSSSPSWEASLYPQSPKCPNPNPSPPAQTLKRIQLPGVWILNLKP